MLLRTRALVCGLLLNGGYNSNILEFLLMFVVFNNINVMLSHQKQSNLLRQAGSYKF